MTRIILVYAPRFNNIVFSTRWRKKYAYVDYLYELHFTLKVGPPDFLSPCAVSHQLFLSTKKLRRIY